MDVLGDYVLHQLIGEGATGAVHRAQDRRSGQGVALKVLHPELARTPESRRQIIDELQPLLVISHPGVARCIECREIDGHIALAYELVEGLTLRAHLERGGRMAWLDAVRIGTQLAEALASAHELTPPIVHRDLRPENIMVTEGNRVKVMDFGIAKVLGAAGQTTTATFGNIMYMSPEQIDAFGIDPRSDVYCLGLVLYELITGSVPFKGSPRDLLNAQCTQPPPPFPASLQANVPADLEAVIRWMLEKSPDSRPSSAREVSRLLQAVQTGQRVSVPAAGTPAATPAFGRPSTPSVGALVSTAPRVAPPSKSTPVGLIAGVAVLMILVGGGIAGFFALSGADDAPSVAVVDASASDPVERPQAERAPTVSTADPRADPTRVVPDDPRAVDDGSSGDPVEAPTTGVSDEGDEDSGSGFGSVQALFGGGAKDPEDPEDPAVAMLLGTHSCGIHWLQRRGKCEISRDGDTLRIDGSQKSSGDFLKLEGTVEVQDDRTFIVKGSLDSRVSSCCGTRKLSGSFKFKRHGKRKFWRLQDAGRICDPFKVCMYYVDVFMKKKGEE